MRSHAGIDPWGQEGAVLGALLGSSALALITKEMVGGPFLGGYRILSMSFLAAAALHVASCCVRRPPTVNLWTVLLLFSTLFFASGGVIGQDPAAGSIARMTLALQALFLLALGLVGSWAGFRAVRGPSAANERWVDLCSRVQTTRPAVVLLVVGVVWALRGYGGSQGLVLSHAGDVMAEAGAGASLAIHLGLLLRPLLLCLGGVLLFDRSPLQRTLGLAIMTGELGWAVLWSRRQLFELIMVLLIVNLWTGRVTLRRLVGWSVVVAFTTLVMWPFMFHLRAVAQQTDLFRGDLAARASVLVNDVLPDAFGTFDVTKSFETRSEYLDNVQLRSRTSELLIDIAAAHRDGAPLMGGEVLLAAVVATIPRMVWPGKERLLASETWQVEELIEQHFGLPISDVASTVLTHGYADGGVVGAVLYMALLGSLLGASERAGRRSGSALLGLWVYALALSLAVQIEANVSDLFAVGRVILVVVCLDRLAGRGIEQLTTMRPVRRFIEEAA